MSKLRYNRAFKNGLIAIFFVIALACSIIAFFIAAKVQYNRLVSNMDSLEATIVDIYYDVHLKGLDEQEIQISYEVDGVVYERELSTDTTISFTAGSGAHYRIGDKIKIFYDPQNPEVIAVPRSMSVGYFWLVFASIVLALVLFALWYMCKHRSKFLVTQKEYDREGQELKRSKLQAKQRKKQEKLKKRKKHAKARKIGKIILIVLGSLVGAFVLYILFGLLLISLRC